MIRPEFARVHHRLWRRRLLVGAGLAGLLAVTGIFAVRALPDGPQVVAVTSASTDPGSRRVELLLPTCNGEVRNVEVREAADEVVVEVSVLGGDSGDDCQDSTPIQLEHPLGSRRLVDGPTGVRAYVEADRSRRYAWIQRATHSEDGRTVTLLTHVCHAEVAEAIVDETPDRVTVAVAHHGTPTQPGCHGEFLVALEAPLGDRQLVDLSSGQGVNGWQY